MDEASVEFSLYERFANNPHARLAEFKYTRMGPKSLALAVGGQSKSDETPARPEGVLFEESSIVGRLGDTSATAHLTTVDIDQDGSQELFFGKCRRCRQPAADVGQ